MIFLAGHYFTIITLLVKLKRAKISTEPRRIYAVSLYFFIGLEGPKDLKLARARKKASARPDCSSSYNMGETIYCKVKCSSWITVG